MGVVMRTYIFVCLLGIISTICIVLLTVSSKNTHKIQISKDDRRATWRQQRRPHLHNQKNHRDTNDINYGNLDPSQHTREVVLDDNIFSVKAFSDFDHRTNRNTASVKDETDATKPDIFSVLEDSNTRPDAETGILHVKEAVQGGMAAALLMSIQEEDTNKNEPTHHRQDRLTTVERVSPQEKLTATYRLESRDKDGQNGSLVNRKDNKKGFGQEHLVRTKAASSEKLPTENVDMQNSRILHVGKQKTSKQKDGPPVMRHRQSGNSSDENKHLNYRIKSSASNKRQEFETRQRTGKKSPAEIAKEVALKMAPQPRLKPVAIDQNILNQENGSYPAFIKTSSTLFRVLPSGKLKTGSCKPLNNMAMMKTHKCSSSTLQNILYRWGDDHNLTFILPKEGPYIGHPQPFDISHAERVVGDKYNIVANHARYNEEGLKKVMPSDTVYFTILRDPVKQFESAFTYYKFDERYGVPGLRSFLKQPEVYFQREPVFPRQAGRNQMMYDLGLDARFMDDTSPEVHDYIAMIEKNFQVVLIAEYFEESLILLKDLLCWTLDDIVYFNQNSRSQSSVRRVTASMRRGILEWNAADTSMYEHFNATLWEKIRRYGVDRMRGEVAQLRLRNEILKKKCIGGKLESHDPRMWYPPGIKVDSFVLNPSARGERLCEQLIRPELSYIDILKTKQRRITARFDRRDEFFRRHPQFREVHARRLPKARPQRIQG
ncbi:uncharacterized protein LOC119722913 [Patiria miniata]|uniref:Uncharacterized protein n=1 Tax=Patiria miniata TaxID=46514 RepID=A0A913ZBT9_PATMI|nr:uncharacterized protein LOC119722913 [Patiria miniata]XP_038049248.1 uncharacterized protein LOC119722913 [Patiria miniata]